MNHIAKQIYNTVLDAQSIVLIPHQGPDGDALGASLAFAEWLSTLGKNFTIFCKTGAATKFSYLPHIGSLTSNPEVWKKEIDVVVVFDSGDLVYAGVKDFVEPIREKVILINIDHHATNEAFGDLNFVDITSSSTSEMVQRFFSFNGISINKEMATSLMTGFITDTDNFTNAATSGSTISAVSHLLKKGGTLTPIQDRVYKNISLAALKVWGHMLERLGHNEELDVVYSYILEKDIVDSGVKEEEREGFFTLMNNYMNNIEEGKIKFLLKEVGEKKWKGSFRVTRDDVNILPYAQAMQGGGHKKSAGFRMDGTVEEALSKIFEIIKNTPV